MFAEVNFGIDRTGSLAAARSSLQGALSFGSLVEAAERVTMGYSQYVIAS